MNPDVDKFMFEMCGEVQREAITRHVLRLAVAKIRSEATTRWGDTDYGAVWASDLIDPDMAP